MTPPPIPEHVRRFIADHLVSVEQLEVLLLLHRARTEWTAERVSEELRTSLTSASQRLADLSERRLVEALEGGRFRFDARDPARAATVEALAAVYEERRYTVIDLIFSKPIDNLRVYADAFRFRKGDEDDR